MGEGRLVAESLGIVVGRDEGAEAASVPMPSVATSSGAVSLTKGLRRASISVISSQTVCSRCAYARTWSPCHLRSPSTSEHSPSRPAT